MITELKYRGAESLIIHKLYWDHHYHYLLADLECSCGAKWHKISTHEHFVFCNQCNEVKKIQI